MEKTFRILTTAILVTLATGSVAQAKISFEIVAVTGEAVPDGNGSFDELGAPVLNNIGEVAFGAILTDTDDDFRDDRGVYVRDDKGAIVQIARKGDTVPDGNGVFFGFSTPVLNDFGQTAFRGEIGRSRLSSSEFRGIFRGDGESSLMQFARTGEAPPDGNGEFVSISHPTLSNSGNVAFTGHLEITNDGDREEAIFRSDGSGNAVQIVRTGDSLPDGNGAFSGRFSQPALNDADQAIFSAEIMGTIANQGIFRSDNSSSLVQVVRVGDETPTADGTFSGFSYVASNSAEQTTFLGGVTANVGDNYVGLFQVDGMNNSIEIARLGKQTPVGDDTIVDLTLSYPTVNEAGQTAFAATIRGPNDNRSRRAIFRDDGSGNLKQIITAWDTVPDGEGIFLNPTRYALNNAGQLAFRVWLGETNNGRDNGIYLYDDQLGLTKLVREGDQFLGSSINQLGFEDSAFSQSGLNDFGQVAFRFSLSDGRNGIAIATIVPEPSTLLLGMLAASVLVLKRIRAV